MQTILFLPSPLFKVKTTFPDSDRALNYEPDISNEKLLLAIVLPQEALTKLPKTVVNF